MPRTYDHQWQAVRPKILARDNWRCRIKGPNCKGDADQVDHIIPVDAGGRRLDPINLRASCGPCNSGRAQREKAAEGWRRSGAHITLVVGGRDASEWVAERSSPADVVVDYTSLSSALGGGHDVASAARNAVLTKVRRGEVDARRVWIVSANDDAASMFPHHDLVRMDGVEVGPVGPSREW